MKNITTGKLVNINKHIDKKNSSINYGEFFIKYTPAVSISKHYGQGLANCPQCFKCQMLSIGLSTQTPEFKAILDQRV